MHQGTQSQSTFNTHNACNPHKRTQLFTEAFSREAQLIWAEPRHHTFLATALLLRGGVGVGDVQRNVARLRGGLRLAHWNEEVRLLQSACLCVLCASLVVPCCLAASV